MAAPIEPSNSGPLAGYRVIDLADEKGEVCAWVLGFLGADVIRVEPPGGDRTSRHRGPFAGDEVDPEKSLTWFSYNSNKRGITLDIARPEGRELLRRLVKDANVVVESFRPGYMASLGVGYEELERLNPRLVLVSISDYGQTGPYRDYKGNDLTHWALSSVMYVSGDPERPPVRVSVPQAYAQAGAQAAIGALLALTHAGQTGHGQQVDQSIQEAQLFAAHNHMQHFEATGNIVTRTGVGGQSGYFKQIWPCKDGYFCFGIRLGGRWGMHNLIAWMNEEGFAGACNEVDWETLTQPALLALPKEQRARIDDEMERFFLAHTKKELYENALTRGIFLYPGADAAGAL